MKLSTSTMFLVGLLTAGALRADFADVPSGTYDVDKAHGYIIFSYNHLGLSNPRVGFNGFDATLELDTDSPSDSTVEVVIDAASVDSRVPVFNEHLNSADWLDTARFPEITFTTTGIEPTGEGRFAVTGDLTVKGITKPVTLDATINAAKTHPLKEIPAVGVSATGTILRSAYGLDAYVPAVTDEVTITIEVEMLKREADSG